MPDTADPRVQRVLVIDDSRSMLRLARQYLRPLDVEVLTATRAEEGLVLARQHRPDMVLCDIVLPGLDGYAFVAELRGDADLAAIPVVLMSSVSALQDRLRAVDSGADDLLSKPFDQAELIARVRALLRLKSREDALRASNRQLHERLYLMSTLFMVANQLRESLHPADILRVIRETLTTIAGAQAFAIYIRDGSTPLFHLATLRGLDVPGAPVQLAISDLSPPLRAALTSGEAYVNAGASPAAPPLVAGQATGPLPIQLLMPLTTRSISVGFIAVSAFTTDHGSTLDFELLALLSSQVAAAIHQSRLHDQLQHYTNELTRSNAALNEAYRTLDEQMFHLRTLSVVSAQLHSSVSVPAVYESIRDLAVNFVGAHSFIVRYIDQWEGVTLYAGTPKDYRTGPEAIDLSPYTQLIQQVETTRVPYFRAPSAPDVTTPASQAPRPARPFACLPLLAEQHLRGVLLIEELLPQKITFTKEDYELLALLTHQAAVALDNGYLHRHMEQLSFTDTLTGAYNRRYFDEQFQREVLRSQRNGAPLTLAMCDIDNFKMVNDRHGHPVGDMVLRQVVSCISASLRQVDIVARYGGEEFAIILPDTDLDRATPVAERLCDSVRARPLQVGDLTLPVTISLGLAGLGAHQDADALLHAADAALLRAKRTGKDRVVTAAEDRLPAH